MSQIKRYYVRNRSTREAHVVEAESAQEACSQLGWMIGDCSVLEHFTATIGTTQFSRICWLDLEGGLAYSRWYRGTAATEQAIAACRARWPTMKFWIDKARSSATPDLTIQDLIG